MTPYTSIKTANRKPPFRIWFKNDSTWPQGFTLADSFWDLHEYTSKSGFRSPEFFKARGKTVVQSEYFRESVSCTVSPCALVGYKPIKYWKDGVLTDGSAQVNIDGMLRSFNSAPISLPDAGTYTTDLSSADNRAKLKLMSRIKDEYNHFQGGTFLHELRQTISLIRKPGKALERQLMHYASSLPKKVRRVPKHKLSERAELVRDTWLTFTLGVAPLLDDIKGLATTAADLGLQGSKRHEGLRSIFSGWFGATPTATTATGVGGQYLSGSGFSDLIYTAHGIHKESAKVSYTAQCDRSILYPQNDLERLVTLSGFSLREWVPTLWNCIPWSFVLDYFTNIGDVVEFYSTDRSSIKGLCRTEIKVIEQSITYSSPRSNDSSDQWSGQLGDLSRRHVRFHRTIIDPLLLDVRFEAENPVANAKKLFNLAALWSVVWHANLNLRN